MIPLRCFARHFPSMRREVAADLSGKWMGFRMDSAHPFPDQGPAVL
jgi:hypothetical protein